MKVMLAADIDLLNERLLALASDLAAIRLKEFCSK